MRNEHLIDTIKLQMSIYDFLKTLPSSCYFFPSDHSCCSIVGSVGGQAVFILITTKNKMTKKQITFSSGVYQSLGEFYCIRSLDDILEIAKIRGWHD